MMLRKLRMIKRHIKFWFYRRKRYKQKVKRFNNQLKEAIQKLNEETKMSEIKQQM